MINKTVLWCLLLVLVALGISGLLGKHVATQYEHELVAWKTLADKALGENKELQQKINKSDSVIGLNKKVVAQKDTIITGLKDSVKKIRARRPNVDTVLATLPDTCKAAKETIESLVTDNKLLDSIVVEDSVRNETQKQTIIELTWQRDNLLGYVEKINALIRTVPIYKEPKLFNLIPLPSRKKAFVAGVVLGAGAFIVTHSHIVR
jgi:hypothetical protein